MNKKTPMAFLNQKVMLGGLTLLMLAAIVIISSFFPLIVDPTRWQTKEFVSNELIVISISLISIISTMFIGQSVNAQNEMSEIAKARVAFFTSLKEIKNISAFCQWVKRVLQKQDQRAIIERILKENGVKDINVISLEVSEIEEMATRPMKIGERYYHKLTKEQKKLVLDIKKGKYAIKMVDPNYYLSVSTIHSDLTISEKSGKEQSKKITLLVWDLFWKILFSVSFAMIFASFVRDTTQEDADLAMAWITFASRMFTLIGSANMGYRTGCQMNNIDADYINVRVSVHTLFKQDTKFVPLTEEELLKEECDRIQEELQNARKGNASNGESSTTDRNHEHSEERKGEPEQI